MMKENVNYGQRITTQELKELLLKEMIYVDFFCKTNNITYFLGGGALIGAVRHKGFIPWDDDIDIFMKRNDYDRFINLFNSNDSGRYSVVSRQNNKKYYLPFAKIIDNDTVLKEHIKGSIPLGVSIDVFPLDYISNETKDNNWSAACKESIWEKCINIKSLYISKDRAIWKNALILAARLICPYPNYYYAVLKEKRVTKFISKSKTEWLANLYGAWGEKEIAHSYCFDTSIELDFEGHKLKVPVGYDEWLKNVYGDYMRLPPAEKRESHHAFDVFWKNMSSD